MANFKLAIKDLITFQTLPYTTLWNIST